jgi:hypothetical protein
MTHSDAYSLQAKRTNRFSQLSDSDPNSTLALCTPLQNAGWPTGMKSVRLYDITYTPDVLTNVGNMSWNRWYPTPTLLPSGKVIIMGGTQVGGSMVHLPAVIREISNVAADHQRDGDMTDGTGAWDSRQYTAAYTGCSAIMACVWSRHDLQ